MSRLRLLTLLAVLLLTACPGTTEGLSPTADVDPQQDTADPGDTPAPDPDVEFEDVVSDVPSDTPPDDVTPTGDTRPDEETPPEDTTPDTPSPTIIRATNPVIAENWPDPHVLRLEQNGAVSYLLTATIHNGGDFPIFTSTDLVRWTRQPGGLLGRTRTGGSSMEINGAHYCSMWAPDLVQTAPGVFMLSFSAQRFASPQSPCPAYREDGGVYLVSAASPTGPFAAPEHPWEPLATGGHVVNCPTDVAIPHSLPNTSRNCQGTWCHHIVRLDSGAWRDPATGRWWLGYAWYTNDPPMVPWEESNHGEHVSLVELDASDPFTVRCDAAVPQLHIGNPHDQPTLDALAASCPRCAEQLSFTRGRFDEELRFSGRSWGINEGVSLFRRGPLVYALMSGSAWDSAFYSVFWVAAPTVEGLALDNPDRLEGRYLVPSQGQAFGHGTPRPRPRRPDLVLRPPPPRSRPLPRRRSLRPRRLAQPHRVRGPGRRTRRGVDQGEVPGGGGGGGGGGAVRGRPSVAGLQPPAEHVQAAVNSSPHPSTPT